MRLFTRAGTACIPNAGTQDKPAYAHVGKCSRCGGAGQAEQWRHTGLVCYQCGGSGLGAPIVDRLYTAEQNAKLDAAQEKRNAKATAKRNAAEAERQAKLAAERAVWLEQTAAFRAQLTQLVAAEADESGYWAVAESNILARQTVPSDKLMAVVEAALAKIAAARASQFVGQVSQAVELTLTCERVIDCSWGSFPRVSSWMHLCRDQDGNVVVYKGAGNFLGLGETGKVKATVKLHETYRDTRQTFIQRPKLVK